MINKTMEEKFLEYNRCILEKSNLVLQTSDDIREENLEGRQKCKTRILESYPIISYHYLHTREVVNGKP